MQVAREDDAHAGADVGQILDDGAVLLDGDELRGAVGNGGA